MCKVNKGEIITVVCLLLFCVVVFLPPIIHGYVYPNVGDDSAGHLAVLDLIQSGSSPSLRYLAYGIVGYPLVWFSNLSRVGIDTVFLWFNYIALALIGVALYFVMSRLVNRTVGWFALVLTLFCAQGLLFMFYYGQIFNIINIGIILPLLIFFVAKYLVEKKAYQLVLAIVFAGLFGAFHTSGLYLPFIAGFITVAYLIYSWDKKQNIEWRGVIFGTGIVILGAVAFLVFTPNRLELIGIIIANIMAGTMAVPIVDYMLGIVSPTILVILLCSVAFYKRMFMGIRKETKILIVILSCVIVVLSVATFVRVSPDPWRQALDLATMLALLAAIFIGLFLERRKDILVIIAVVIVVFAGLFHNIPTWFDYNSAIRPVDKWAIEFINNPDSVKIEAFPWARDIVRDCQTYSCSAEVAPWVYSRFLKAEYIRSGGEVLIVRSLPMTPRSDKDNMWYGRHGVELDESDANTERYLDGTVRVYISEGYTNAKRFRDGEVFVYVYAKMDRD